MLEAPVFHPVVVCLLTDRNRETLSKVLDLAGYTVEVRSRPVYPKG